MPPSLAKSDAYKLAISTWPPPTQLLYVTRIVTSVTPRGQLTKGHTVHMSQAKPYREFKFVDGASRKRRRRGARSKLDADPASSGKANTRGDAFHGPAASSAAYQRRHAGPPRAPSTLEPPQDDIAVSRISSSPDDAVLSGIYNAVDLAFGNDSFHPFFDSGISPTFSGDQPGNVPFYFGPDLTICELDETSLALDTSTAQNRDSSDHHGTGQAKETGFGVNGGEAVDMSWINSNIGSNNLSDTIAQLLARCTHCALPVLPHGYIHLTRRSR